MINLHSWEICRKLLLTEYHLFLPSLKGRTCLLEAPTWKEISAFSKAPWANPEAQTVWIKVPYRFGNDAEQPYLHWTLGS